MVVEARIVPDPDDTSVGEELKQVALAWRVLTDALTARPELREASPSDLDGFRAVLKLGLERLDEAGIPDSITWGLEPLGGAGSGATRVWVQVSGTTYLADVDEDWIPSVGHPDDWLVWPIGVSYGICKSMDGPLGDLCEKTLLHLQASGPLEEEECTFDLPDELPDELPELGPLEWAPVRGVVVRFGVSRTGITSALVETPPATGSPGPAAASGAAGNAPPVMIPRFDPQSASGDGDFGIRFFRVEAERTRPRVRLRIRFRGDPPVLSAVTWIGDSFGRPGGDPATMPEKVGTTFLADLLDRRPIRSEEWVKREAWIVEDPGDPNRIAHKLFLALDKASLDEGLSTAQREGIEAINMALTAAYRGRGSKRVVGRGLLDAEVDGAPPPPQIAAMLGPVARMLLESMGELRDGVVEMDAVADAFFRFACGECTAFDSHGAPNGVNMFSFAELAFLLHDHAGSLELAALGDALGIGGSESDLKRFFRDYAAVACAACEMFVRCYGRGSHRKICSYRAGHNQRVTVFGGQRRVRPLRRFSPTGKHELHDRWKDRLGTFDGSAVEFGQLRDEFGRLVCTALQGSLQVDARNAPHGGAYDITQAPDVAVT